MGYEVHYIEDGITNGDDLNSMLMGEESSNNGGALSWMIGSGPFQAVGPIMFNFAFVVTSSSSITMAKSECIAHKALSMSCIMMGALYAVVGLVGAPLAHVVKNGMIEGGDDINLISLVLLAGSTSGNIGTSEGSSSGGASILDLLCIASFGFSTLVSVPVYCLLAKETLINDARISIFPALFLSYVLPWILVALVYISSFFESFVNWSGLIVLGYANFSLPLLLDMRLKRIRAFWAMSRKKSNTESNDGEGVLSREDERSMTITSVVFSLVTASISSVIAMSIANSLILAGIVFIFVLLVTAMWPSASFVLR